MKIPISWIKEFVSLPPRITPTQIADAFVRVGFEVESIEYQGSDISGPLVVGKVLSIEELTGHKKPIRYVGLDVGSGKTRYVICGARNFKVNDLVVVAIPGAVLPGNFEISARQTYGKTSDGMICSAKELGISEEHAGIIVLPEGQVGGNAKELLEISDVVLDIAVNPDRGYAMSVRGLSRELAASLGVKFKDPALSVNTKKFSMSKSTKAVGVKIEDRSGADQIYIRTVHGVNGKKPSPLWMSRRIEKCGMRSISLAVDITNYVMLELGQPLHAFDADVITGALKVTRAKKFSALTTLDKVERSLKPDDLVIADGNSVLALAGTMGGLASEVSSNTTKIAIEAAHFDPISVAKNSRSHRLSSEASKRIERNTDPALTSISSARAIQLLIDLADAKYVGSSQDGLPIKNRKVKISTLAIAKLLGRRYSNKEVKDALIKIGCKVLGSADQLNVEVPTWRPDLFTNADFAEEVARISGYEKIPNTLPTGKNGAQLNSFQSRKRAIANLLAAQGYSEVINYPFVNQDMVDLLGFSGDRAKSFKILNPMSEDAPLLRTHLLPGLLSTLARNISRGAKDLAIFEIGTVFRNTAPITTSVSPSISKRPSDKLINQIFASVPKQMTFVAGVTAGEKIPANWKGSGIRFDWSDAIAKAAEIIESTGNSFEIENCELAPWHPGRCAEFKVSGKVVAHAGELHPRVLSTLGLPERSCAFAVILSELPKAQKLVPARIWSMPAAVQDVALVVSKEVSVAKLKKSLKKGAGDLLESIRLFDRYDKVGENKVSLAFTLTFRAWDRTLTSDEVAKYRDSAIEQATKDFGATLRS
jgi:phenylalanyl-tRNA synthetase beta chain